MNYMSTKDDPAFVYGYCRYGTHRQDDTQSIQDQMAEINKFANEHNIKMIKFFTDEAISGTKAHRPGLNAMKERLKTNPDNIKYVLSTSP